VNQVRRALLSMPPIANDSNSFYRMIIA